jgi:hypothetical protein
MIDQGFMIGFLPICPTMVSLEATLGFALATQRCARGSARFKRDQDPYRCQARTGLGHSLLKLPDHDHPCRALEDRDVRGLGEKRPKLAAPIPIYSARLGCLERCTVSSPPPLARSAQDEELDRAGDNLSVVHLKRLAFFFAPPSNSARQAGLR